ncbi:retrovirus-related pol polyprotein from transposon TNT 1-94 [Tanacetum coccineum]
MSNSNTNLQTQSSNALHNAIMEAGSKDRPPMLAPGSSETTIERYMENYKNVSQDIRDQLNAEAEAVQIILTGIDNDIYSTVDACPNACEMWKAIERLKQGESINVQDLETNLYWEFGKFTSRDGESLESYYSRFYKMMNELVRNQCHVTNHQVNVQFLLQLQPEWQRLARTANPLALVAQQQPVYHPQNHPTQNTQYSSTRSQQSTRNRGKAIVTSSAPTYDPEPATINRGTGYDNQRAVNVVEDRENVDKELDKVIALENKVKVLNDIVYKTGQSVQTMNMLNRNCKTSFAKPKFLKKAQRSNPRLYDIGCYNDNLALMLAPDSDETIRLEKERRSKLSDLIRPFDYDQLNNLYDLFVPQREKSAEQHYFPKTSKMSHTSSNNEFSKESFRKQTTLLEKRMDESIPWDQKCKSSKELFKIKKSVDTIFDGVERCKQTIAKRTYFGNIDPFIQNTIEGNFCPQIRRINADLENFHLCLNEEMVADLRYFNSLEHECKEKIKNDKSFKENQSNVFLKEREQYFEIQDLKAQLQDKGIAISELKKLIEKMKGKSVETKFEKSSVIRQPNAFKSQRQSILGVIPNTSVSRPQLKSNQLEDRVMSNNSQGKKQEVEDHRRNFKFSNNKTSVTACNDSLNAKTSNVNFVCVTCGKCMLNDNHDLCVLHYINGVSSRTRQPIDVPISSKEPNALIEIILFIVDSGCSKHMTGNLKLLTNFVEKFLGTVKFGNDQIAPIIGYGDLVQGKITIKRVYYVEGLNHNLFSVGQFSDADLEVAFWKSTCYIRNLKGNDLLTCSRGTDLYSITLQDTSTPNLICLMAKATSSQAWLWHRRLSHLNFDSINLLSKNDIVIGLPKLKFDSPHESKTKQPKVLIDFPQTWSKRIHGFPHRLRTDRTRKSTNLESNSSCILAQEWIKHQTSVARTPEQNGVVKRWNCTLVEAARTMLSAAKVPLYFWAEAIATTCFTQNRSLVIPRHEKTPYHIINGRKPSVKFFHIFGSLCYIVRDGENLDKMKEKGDACIFVGYSTQSRAYRVYNKRTRVIVETIHVNFDELPQMASDHVTETVTTSNELDLLFSPMFDELLNGTTPVVSKSSAVNAVDAPDKRQQQNTTQSTTTTVAADIPPLNIQTTPETTSQAPTQVPTVTANENIIQAETNKEYAQVDEDEFINVFSTPIQEQGE